MTSTEAWERIAQAFQYLATGGSETPMSRGHLFEELARVSGEMAGLSGGPASQLDANGTILDVDVITAGEVLTRVGTTIVSTPAGAPGAHAVTHQNGGTDQINVGGLAGVLANPQPPIIGAGGAQAVAGNDARLTDARVPVAHKVSHQDGGSDEIVVTGLSGVLADPQPPIIGAGAAQAVAGNDARLTDARTPTAHKVSHQDGGTDEILVTGLSGLLADPQHPIIGALVTEAVAGNDARLTNARTPTAHHVSHENGGTDQISVAGLTGLLGTAQTPAAHIHPESDVTNLVADLAARALIGQLIGSYDLGNASMVTGQFLFQYRRLTLSGAERLTIPGTSNAVIADLASRNGLILGTPKTYGMSFTIPNDYVSYQSRRVNICGEARGNLLGTSNLIVSDDFSSRNRLVLAGRS
jgi:hypothetical protein